jgi:hypothetical protein
MNQRRGLRLPLLFLLLGLAAAGALAQQRPQPSVPSEPRATDNAPPFGPSRNLKLIKESFEQTQKDTQQLYALATELKQEMENANEDVLSLNVMKKAEAIEKLAEKIKNRMKNL